MQEHKNPFDELLELIHLEQLELNLFRGESRDLGSSRVFGGQVLCQSLLAASETMDDRLVHSLHAYFLRSGDPQAPIVYNVDRSRDGRSFSARRVVAIQHGRPIFTMAASFQVEEEGLEHQAPIPDVPDPDEIGEKKPIDPEGLSHLSPKIQRWLTRFGPFEFRRVGDYDPVNPLPQEPQQHIWFRLRGQVPDNPVLHRALLAYVSDFHLVGTASLPHGLSWVQGKLIMASLDHAMWFHRPCKLDDWLLYTCDSPNSSGGRGLSRGMIYNRNGVLVASTAQEGVIRVRRDRKDKAS